MAIKIKPGDVFWLNLEIFQNTQNVSHPYLVLEELAEIQPLYRLCCVTTNWRKANWPGIVFLEEGEANLKKPSLIDVSRQVCVSRNELGDYVGCLSEPRLIQIYQAIKIIQNIQHYAAEIHKH